MTEQSPETIQASWSPHKDNEFDFAKAVFEQNFEQFRHLNDQMNRIPAFAVTLTGGFWYIAVVVADYGNGLDSASEQIARWALMIFAGICNFALIGIAIRIRNVMSDYLDRVRRFEGDWWTERTPTLPMFISYSMISLYSVLILAGGILSWAAAFVLFWPARTIFVGWGVLIVIGALAALFVCSYLISRWLTPKSA